MENSMNGNERLVNVEELARILGVPGSWIYEKCRGGTSVVPLPSLKVGRYRRFVVSDVLTWLRETGGSNQRGSRESAGGGKR